MGNIILSVVYHLFCCDVVFRGILLLLFFLFQKYQVMPCGPWKLRDSLTKLFRSLGSGQLIFLWHLLCSWACTVGKRICISGLQHRLNSGRYARWLIHQHMWGIETTGMDEVSQGKCACICCRMRRQEGWGDQESFHTKGESKEREIVKNLWAEPGTELCLRSQGRRTFKERNRQRYQLLKTGHSGSGACQLYHYTNPWSVN